MYKTLKLEYKCLCLTRDKNEIEKQLIRIYSRLFGYYCALKDNDVFNLIDKKDILDDLDDRLKLLFGTNNSLLSYSNNRLESVQKFVNDYYNNKNNYNKEMLNKLNILLTTFFDGYDYYNYNIKNSSIMDRLFKCDIRKEEKILNLKNDIDIEYDFYI